MGLNIKAVAELTGVPLHTLRAWERRYGVPRPRREKGNRYRSYDDNDIAEVRRMKQQVDAGVSPAQASVQIRQHQRSMGTSPVASQEPLSEIRQALLLALTRQDETVAQNLLNQAVSMFSVERVVLEIIGPTLRAIGDEWQDNLLSIEQEHFASNLIRQRLLALVQAQPPLPPTSPRLVAACAPEEQHELGLLCLTLLARRQGWNVTYLGQRTPIAAAFEAARAAPTRVILISVTTVTGLASLIPLFNPRTPPPVALIWGGELLNNLPSLRAHVPGAFFGEDAIDGLNQLLNSTPKPNEWKPSARALATAEALQAHRLELAGATEAGFSNALSRRPAGKDPLPFQRMMLQTLFLIDALACALAFGVPELMDAQGQWLAELLAPRGIETRHVDMFLDVFARAAERALPPLAVQQVTPMLARLREKI